MTFDNSNLVTIAAVVNESVAVASLSTICLLYYFIHLYYLGIERREHEKAKRTVSGLEDELRLSHDGCAVAVVESELLRQILGGQSLETMLQSVVQQFVPIPQQGWVTYIDLNPEPHVVLSRGEFQPPAGQIDINDPQLAPALAGRIVTFQEPRVAKSKFLANFNAQDCNRFEYIYVLGVGIENQTYGLLVTTQLFPVNAQAEQQFQLARRMCAGLARYIAGLNAQAMQQRELRLNSNRLTVRSLFDHEFTSTKKMTHQFLRTLRMLLEADCGVLFLSPPLDKWHASGCLSTGSVPQTCDAKKWHTCEEQVTQMARELRGRVLFDEYGLELLDLNQTFKAALVMPIAVSFKLVGTMCFTKSSSVAFTSDQEDLVKWSVELFVEQLTNSMKQAEIKRLAQVDAVTQIANRHSFDRELENELEAARASGKEFSIILLDLDRFKLINDTYGHLAGDKALLVMGQLLKDSLARLRSDDRAFCARFGGEEFAVLLSGIGIEGALRIGELIRADLERTKINWQGTDLSMTVSGGVATYPYNGTHMDELIAKADAALYQAKNQGRNRIHGPDQLPNDSNAQISSNVPVGTEAPTPHAEDSVSEVNGMTQLQPV
jgi:diguanylate cyclase (GGDEF)-like protein